MAFLELKDIGKIYVNEGNVSVGVRGVNLKFEKGEFVAVTGKSGSGKSTFLNVVSGMDTYEEGELYIEGNPTSHFLQPDWEKYRSKYISFIFQDYNIIESFTVLQNVELALMDIQDKKARRKRALELIERVGMTSHLKHKGSKLSGGQKQRTVIARALAKDSPIILADEPTGNLDSVTSAEIINLLREVSKDKLLIVVTHNYEEVEKYATRHIRFFDGSVESDTVQINSTKIQEQSTNVVKKEETKVINQKKKAIKDGFTLGKAIFSSRPKLSFFLCVLLLIGTLGIYASTASFGDVKALFEKHYMFNNIEGRVILTKRNGETISKEELEKISKEYGASSAIHYDLLLDLGDNIYFSYFDEEIGYTKGINMNCTFGEDFGDDIIGRYPTKTNEVFLYLPISYSLTFGEKELKQKELSYEGAIYTVTGIKYYYDNNLTGKCLFTKEGFDIATAIYSYTSMIDTYIQAKVFSKDGKQIAETSSYKCIPSFEVDEGKIFVYDDPFTKSIETLGDDCIVNIETKSTYYNYNYYYESFSSKSQTITKNFDKEYLSKKPEKIEKNENLVSQIYIHPSLILELNNEILEKSYKQASLFFENTKQAMEKASDLNKTEYIAVTSDTTYSPDPSYAVISVIGAVAMGLLWFFSIVFLAFFINLCTGRTLDAFKGDMAIMRSMGINVKTIKIGMYVRTFMALIPSFVLAPVLAVIIYTSPKLNQYFMFLYPYHYAAMVVGLIILVLRITKKQVKRLFGESVKKSLKGGTAE